MESVERAPETTLAVRPEEVKAARITVAPPYLKRRVARQKRLPKVELMLRSPSRWCCRRMLESGGGEREERKGEEGEVLLGVLSHVVGVMKEDPFLMLMSMIRYR